MKLEIAFLYSDLMNIYGDRGNILTLTRRCLWRDIEAEVTSLSVGDKVDPDKYDLYFFGGGQDREQYAVADDLRGEKGQLLKQAGDSGAVFLGVCGGYQLLGHYYRPFEGPDLRGIGLLDIYTQAGNNRFIGNVVIASEFGNLVAFENHSGKTYLGSGARPLGKSLVGRGNNGEDGFEGAIQNNVFGCYLHGSLLPKNPYFADHLIKLALQRRYGAVQLSTLNDSFEKAANQAAAKRARDTR